MPLVVFSLKARTKLEQRLARRLFREPALLEFEMANIRDKLQAVFPHAKVAIVQDLYSGFRIRACEYILLVEIANSQEHDGLSVVKLGPPSRLWEEWEAWQSCKPHGLRHDLVLMELRRIPEAGPTIEALLYADAQQLIGVDETLTLERAMLDAVRLGVPTITSVVELLYQLFQRLGLILYRHSDEANLAQDPLFVPDCLDKKLLENLKAWEQADSLPAEHLAVTIQTCTEHPLQGRFRDPVQMMRSILRAGSPGDYIPRMLRGRAHGDLHGRNVLVGRVEDQVLWPAVYDFGNMGRQYWIGWDFVKLETEFKIRAYPLLFPGELVRNVIPFEVKLFEQTEQARRTGAWPSQPGSDTPVERLRWLLLKIRQYAGQHLSYHGRHSLWLHEYYFLLMIYGLNAARFTNLTSAEYHAACLSAGAAAARFCPLTERV